MENIHKQFTLHSPNTVFANALDDPFDLVSARLKLQKKQPEVINFYVGTQINGYPHIGTYLVQAMAFHLATRTREKTGIPTKVSFGALDNAPFKIIKDNGCDYQMIYRDALGDEEIKKVIEKYYTSYFKELSAVTKTPFEIMTYTEQQQTKEFREEFLRILPHLQKLGIALSPSKGHFKIRIPNNGNKLAEKHALHTHLIECDPEHAIIESQSIGGTTYTSLITADDKSVYLDISTFGRNLIKELVSMKRKNEMPVMVKGGDWIFGCTLVDLGLGIIGKRMDEIPLRMFAPQIVTPEGAKLSKSLIREGIQNQADIPPYFLDMSVFKDIYPNTAEKMLSAADIFTSNARHLFRNYSYHEIDRILRMDSTYIDATRKIAHYSSINLAKREYIKEGRV